MGLAVLLSGCASVSTRAVTSLAPFKHIFVIHRLADDHHLDELFVGALQRAGHDASSGPLTLLPDNADAVLTYEDRWEWDFKTYLIEVTFEVHTARTEKKLADGRYYAPSPKSRPPAEIVGELVDSLVKAR